MPSGHATCSGQFFENHNIAASNLPVCRSAPPATKSSFLPSLKTMVETRDRERVRAAQNASATVSSSSVIAIPDCMRVFTRACQDMRVNIRWRLFGCGATSLRITTNGIFR